MERRHLLKAVALVSTVPLVLSANTSLAQSSTPAAGGDAETRHADDTKKIGTLSLAASRAAATMAHHARVKEFANFEVAEQETVADILNSMSSSKPAEGALHPPSEAEVEAALSPEDKAALSKLKGLKGADFDKAYVKAQIDGHNKLLTIQEDYLKIGKDREHLDVAKLARGMIKEHLTLLGHLEHNIG